MSSHFDLVCVGGGSGGIAAAVQAARLGKQVAIVEENAMGGTCVNRGCIPKKAFWYAANLAHILHHDVQGYGFDCMTKSFDWSQFKRKRQQYISNIHNSYQQLFKRENVTVIHGHAQFKDEHTLLINQHGEISADYFLLAPGAYPVIPEGVVGARQYGITSDEFFELDAQPKKVVVVGGGYIGTEISGALHALGTTVHWIIRRDKPLNNFDTMLSDAVMDSAKKYGLMSHTQANVVEIAKNTSRHLTVSLTNGTVIDNVDHVIWAVGRKPMTKRLGLDKTAIQCDSNGHIMVDQCQMTHASGIFAIGDATVTPQLTPVAVKLGRKLARYLFSNEIFEPINMDLIPTVVFCHPPIGTIGLTENQAKDRYDEASVKTYHSKFVPLYSAISDFRQETYMKLVVVGAQEKVVGCHIFGLAADEILQGFATAISMGATKRDLDETVAIHPTSAEELVTMR